MYKEPVSESFPKLKMEIDFPQQPGVGPLANAALGAIAAGAIGDVRDALSLARDAYQGFKRIKLNSGRSQSRFERNLFPESRERKTVERIEAATAQAATGVPTNRSYGKMPVKKIRRSRKNAKSRATKSSHRTIVRATDLKTTYVIAPSGSSAAYVYNPSVDEVLTSDLTAMYKAYRLKKVVMKLWATTDPGNNGLSNNMPFLVSTCCDPEDGVNTITSFPDMLSADNAYHKVLTSADPMYRYTFYPKATESIASNAAGTTFVGSGVTSNPWIKLDATGITVKHNSLKLLLKTPGSVTAAGVGQGTGVIFEYHFEVKGQQ